MIPRDALNHGAALPESWLPIKDSFHPQKLHPSKQGLSKLFLLLSWGCFSLAVWNSQRFSWKLNQTLKFRPINNKKLSGRNSEMPKLNSWVLLTHFSFPAASTLIEIPVFKTVGRKGEKALISENIEGNMLQWQREERKRGRRPGRTEEKSSIKQHQKRIKCQRKLAEGNLEKNSV